MANSRSDVMANLLQNPQVKSSTSRVGSRVRVKDCVVVLDNTEGAGHIVPLARFHAGDRILKIEGRYPAFVGATDVDIGLYAAGDWTVADQTVVDQDILVSADNWTAAVAIFTDLGTGAAGERAASATVNELWQDAALTANDGRLFDLAITFVADPGAAGTAVIRITYVAGD